ncbi:MAG: hypothetical protein WA790_02530 [Sulfitobacter sp.]
MSTPAEIYATYLENEAHSKALIPCMGVDDYARCVDMAAQFHGVSYEVARDAVSDNLSVLGAG